MNSGLIRGGTEQGSDVGISLQSAATSVVNPGTIESTGGGGDAVFVSSDFGTAATLRIENHRTIRGVTADGRDASANTRDALFVTHTGLITG